MFLLESPGQQEDELFIRQSFQGADRNIEGNLTAIVTLECDADLRGPYPAVRKASRPRRFERAPVKSGPIRETTHWRETLGLSFWSIYAKVLPRALFGEADYLLYLLCRV